MFRQPVRKPPSESSALDSEVRSALMKKANSLAETSFLCGYVIITNGRHFERQNAHHCFCHCVCLGASHLGANLNLTAPN